MKLTKTYFIIDNAKIIPQSYSINDKEPMFFDETKTRLEEIPNIFSLSSPGIADPLPCVIAIKLL